MIHMRSIHFNLHRHQDKGTGDLHELFLGMRTYGFITRVKIHIQTCRDKEINLFQTIKCEFCTTKFPYESGLKRHMRRTHSTRLTPDIRGKHF